MYLLVTGGCGFIGSNFIRHVMSKHPGYRVVNLDSLTYAGNRKNLSDIESDKNYRFVKGDINDEKAVSKLVREADAIVNFAAESHVDRSIDNAKPFLKTNVLGTYTLLQAARMHGKKMLHISTDEVYGSIEKGSFTEESMLNPRNPYSASKAAADLLCLSYFSTYNLPVTIARSSNNFGPYQYPEKIIPLFITSLLKGKKVPVYGDGKNVRDWIFVQDNCEAIDFVLHKGKPGQIYNIPGRNEIPNIKLTRKILSIMGKDESAITFVKDRKGHDRRYSMSGKKLESLGWKPGHDLDKSLKATVDWYRNNRQWWEK